MRDSIWKNADGLEVGFGSRDTRNLLAGTIETKGQRRQVELEVYFSKDSKEASVRGAVIPAGATVLSAHLNVKEAFVGGTSVAVGVINTDGTSAVAGGLVTATQGAVASLTKGASIVGTGATKGTIAAAPLNLTTTFVGTFTAGRASVLVEYIMPSA